MGLIFNSRMTKADLIQLLSTELGIDKEIVNQVITGMTEVITDEMKEGREVIFRGFGTFENKRRARKKARNLATGAEITIEPHYTPGFRASKELIEKVRYSETNKAKIQLEEAQVAKGEKITKGKKTAAAKK